MHTKRLKCLYIILFLSLILSESNTTLKADDDRIPVKIDKWKLWSGKTLLRGANIYQRHVYPELDGPTFLGPGPLGPPYIQKDFDRLAGKWANYVNISHPGLFTEKPPYVLNEDVQQNLDNLLEMIAKANMFAVISFRTGPGRSEFTFFWDSNGDWFDESYLNDSVWQDSAAQNAWIAMLQYTATRYKDYPVVVGYDLMVEPNSNEVGSHPLYDKIDIWNPEQFYSLYGNTLYDWNQLYPQISTAIRQVDNQTPILIGCMGYSAVDWLQYMQVTGDSRTVYTIHQYEPFSYTHQSAKKRNKRFYPGKCDIDRDGKKETFNKKWIKKTLSPVITFKSTHNVPVSVNEFGLMRWEAGAYKFMYDQIKKFEKNSMNHAVWLWETSWRPYEKEVDAFNFRHGPNPNRHKAVESSKLETIIKTFWNKNVARPFKDARNVELTKAKSWGYWLQNIDIQTIVNSPYDVIVIDYSSDGSDQNAFTAQQISQIKNSGKIVLAYLSIGEAEDYRFYWKKKWKTGSPGFLLKENPNWPGNYRVKFWNKTWYKYSLKPYLKKIIAASFDGVYLDTIDTYYYCGKKGLLSMKGSARKMVELIKKIGKYCRSKTGGDFIVCPQNGLLIMKDIKSYYYRKKYLRAINCVGVEDLFYNIESEQDKQSRLKQLEKIHSAGKMIFNIEYIDESKYSEYSDILEESPLEIIGYPSDPDKELDRLIIPD
ncbi:MAG: endo alpha-1,4 polygalactosaminidase [Candidatus Theseobacter exili]|nr:endo alpha-1,4 polygalactosaminidase [Candidatus Theseobacter exili]